MIANQETLNLSPNMAIYDIVVPKDNMLRQINDSELKQRHGDDIATSTDLFGMQMQGAMTILGVNLIKIITLMKKQHMKYLRKREKDTISFEKRTRWCLFRFRSTLQIKT